MHENPTTGNCRIQGFRQTRRNWLDHLMTTGSMLATSVLHTAQHHLPLDLTEAAIARQTHLHTASSSTLSAPLV
jgi:hypothetical protein